MEQQILDGTFCEGFFGYAKIYTLNGLDTKPFYVGCTTTDVEERLRNHLHKARQSFKYEPSPSIKDKIIIDNLFQISAEIVDMIWVTGLSKAEANVQARFLEYKWVQKLKKEGFDLCNIQLVDETTNRPQFIGKIVYAA